MLGSGSARGLAHIGVIEALIEKNIHPQLIVGSSMGALVGAYYARWGNVKALKKFAEEADLLSLLKLTDFNLISISQGFIKGRQIERLLEKFIGKIYFRHLKIPLAVTATDIYRGQKVIIRRGPLIEAIRASISIPAIFSPVFIKGKVLIDGGIIDPLPILTAKNLGGGFIVASNVLRANLKPITFKKDISVQLRLLQYLPHFYQGRSKVIHKKQRNNYPNIFQTIVQSFYAMEYELIRKESKEADILVECGVEKFGAFEFYRAREIISAGYAACHKVLTKISNIQ